ncbi:FG-GAP-like repeat-containing protein [Pareuzebyella sediminis]|uniref:FG-GAP-like repeat-containing protein n=1 Tax=Pareuzebyella sediminis TaxID=2607998 RepID=UPI0011F06F7E|nr:FG-GAP-like repeat-containing protein [Pareuzebyella sediminis]
MKLVIRFIGAFLFFGSLGMFGQQEATDAGTTPGALTVSRVGAAIYNIPIETPPGIRQIAPEIGITFNSQVRNSLVGWGWNISGLSSITRIAPTLYHDGYKEAVNFTKTDRFALDGQRLMVTSGSYGSEGATYRTENYSNIKVVSYGTSQYGKFYGPSYFIVYYPDGSRAWYGTSTASSRLEWAIAKWEDPQGNSIVYQYKIDNGVLRVHKIFYGAKGFSGPNSIDFHYKKRVRPENFYVANFPFDRNYILDRIEVASSGVPYRKYQISHKVNSLGYETIERVQEFNGLGDSFEPIVFNYADTEEGINLLANYNSRTIYPGISSINSETLTGDFNGDGRMDLLSYFTNDKTRINVFTDLHKGSDLNLGWEIATGAFDNIISGSILSSNGKMLPGQGITTINETSIGGNPSSNVLFKTFAMSSTGAIFQYDRIWNAPKAGVLTGCTGSDYFSLIEKKYISGDFNGDGLLDVIALSFPYSEQNCTTKLDCLRPGHISCCDCTENETINSKAHFIDLDRNKTSGFVNSIGQLNARLSSKDRLLAADFTGDGKTDLVHIKSGYLYVYSLENNNRLKQVAFLSNATINLDMPILIGDYNGDGMMDLSIAIEEGTSEWQFFLFRGTDFEVFSKHITATYHPNARTANSLVENHYIAQDFNGDGKTDILRHIVTSFFLGTRKERLLLYTNSNIEKSRPIFEKKIDKSYEYAAAAGENYGLPIALEARFSNRNLEYGYISGNILREYEFLKDNRKDLTLTSVLNNGIKNLIEYHPFPYSDNQFFGNVYTPASDEVYPYVNVNNVIEMNLVKGIEESGSGILRKRDFFYEGAVAHAKGLGFLGFKVLHRSNWYGDNVGTLWSSSRQDPQKNGATIEEWTANYRSKKPSNYVSRTSYKFITKNTGNKIFINVPESTITHDAVKGVTTRRNYIYDSFYNPTKITTTNSAGSTLEEFDYANNPSADNQHYHIGRPIIKMATSILDDNSFFTQEEYGYSDNLLTSIKRKGNGTDYIIENFQHDVYGNIIEKQTKATAMETRHLRFTFSDDGRFLVKEENIEGQTANYQYDSTGNIISALDFMGQKMLFEYDGWNRLRKQTNYLGKSTRYYYEEVSGGGMRLFTDHDQGRDSYEYFNVFGWTYLTNTLVLNGRWIKKSFKYDAVGRLTHESEPYWDGKVANQWNVNIFDEYGRTIERRYYTGKTEVIEYHGLVATVNEGSKNTILTYSAAGNIKNLQDSSGRITYTYFGNGSLKEVDYSGQKTSMSIDGWGRRTKLVDPSAGMYTYEYNMYGELLKETTPKGQTKFEYDKTGKILKKTVLGDETDLQIEYSYTTYYNQLSKIIGVDKKNGKLYNYSYGYDTYHRPSRLSEDTPGAYYEKDITYDTFGRPLRETYVARLKTGTTIESKVRVRNSYDTDSGMLEQILDDYDSSFLWELQAHNQRGQASSISYGNGFERISKFDVYGLPKKITVFNDSGDTVSHALHMDYSFNAKRGLLNSRENLAFTWQETFSHDQMDRLESISGSTTRNQSYDILGRIDTNSEIGSYGYDSSKKYRLSELVLNTKGEQYFSGRATQSITYNVFKKPVEIYTEGKGRASFEYSVLGSRSNAWYGGLEENKLVRQYHKQYSAIMPVEIIEDKRSGNVKILTYIGGDGYSAPIVNIKTKNNDISGYHYLHRDYLGSILAITDAQGAVKEQRQFGAWGTVDKFIDSKGTVFKHESILGRGFTGHEHFFELGLIHMNGRMYDPQMGRFLSPDNFVQNPFDTQSYNRYGYVMNNPLVYNDPSGEMAEQGGNGWLYWLGAGAVSSFASSWEDVQSWDWKGFGDAIARPFRETGHWFRRLFGGGRGHSPPSHVVVAPTASVSIDPLVRTNVGLQSVLTSSGSGGVAGTISWYKGFSVGALRGFVAGAESSWDFVKSLTTVNGWISLGGSFLSMSEMASAYSLNGTLQRGQMIDGTANFIARIPDMSPGQLGYFSGFASEKIVEGVIVSRGAELFSNTKIGTRAVVVGEGMDAVKTTVKTLQSQGVNAKWYQSWSKNFPTNRLMTPVEINAAHARNARWLNTKIDQGYKVYDIGIDATRTTRSSFYQLERSILQQRNYPSIIIPR